MDRIFGRSFGNAARGSSVSPGRRTGNPGNLAAFLAQSVGAAISAGQFAGLRPLRKARARQWAARAEGTIACFEQPSSLPRDDFGTAQLAPSFYAWISDGCALNGFPPR